MDKNRYINISLSVPRKLEVKYLDVAKGWIQGIKLYDSKQKPESREKNYDETIEDWPKYSVRGKWNYPVLYKICFNLNDPIIKKSEVERLELLLNNPEINETINGLKKEYNFSALSKDDQEIYMIDSEFKDKLYGIYRYFRVEDFLYYFLDKYVSTNNRKLIIAQFKKIGGLKAFPYWRLCPHSEDFNLNISKFVTVEDIKKQTPAIKKLRNFTGEAKFLKTKPNQEKYLKMFKTNYSTKLDKDGYFKSYDLIDDLFEDDAEDQKKLNRIRQYRHRLNGRYAKKAS